MKNSKSKVKQTNTHTANHMGDVILHLSDLHFINRNNEADIAKNENIQRDLIRRLQELDNQWMPTIICITGDISDKNKEDGYKLAKVFINGLAKALDIPPENIVICPGNHDLDQKKANKFYRNKTIQDVIDNFKIPISADYDEVFLSYIAFCEELKIPKCTYGDYTSYLFGIRKVGDINFIICNSNWYYVKKPSLLSRLARKIFNFNAENKVMQNSENRAWICQPLLEYLENKHDLLKKRQEHQGFFIGLLHHPSEKLDDREKYRRSSSKSPPTAVYLAKRSDLVLTGHMHGLPLGITSFLTADSINCGSTLQESSIDKAFYIIKVTDFKIKGISFKFDPLSSENKWVRDGDEFTALTPLMYEKISDHLENNPQSQLMANLASSVDSKQPSSGTYSSLLEEIIEQVQKAELHIEKLEFTEAFGIVDQAEEALEPLGSTIQSDELSDIYTRISLIECVRADLLHHNKGVPGDYSVAKEYLERAKNARRK